jgi:mannose-6-phosphate isomerase-like protein (cupin superfamily)
MDSGTSRAAGSFPSFAVVPLDDVLARPSGPYDEFLRVADLSVGLYRLAAGAVDRQQPHTEDEVYIVMAGRSRFTAGDDTRDVGPGDTIYVAAHVPHKFHDITDELRLLVVFAPPEDSRKG